jgi:hypothetical protein
MKYFLTALLLASGCSSTPPASIRTDISGKWGWVGTLPDSCGVNAEHYAFSEDGRELLLTREEPIDFGGKQLSEFHYEILAESRRIMRMRILGEYRRTSSGQPVVWDLVLKSRNRFCWHRTDWQSQTCTSDILRCDE